MTLVVGLVGKDHILMAADTDTRLGDAGGYYGTKCHKLLSVNSETWVLGVAGDGSALGLISKMSTLAPSHLSGEKFIHWYADYFFSLYKQDGLTESMWFLMAGHAEGKPLLFRWSVEKTGYDPSLVQPHAINGTHDVVGASTHGALYFVNRHNSSGMSLGQHIRLAHFAIYEATRQDARLGLPVEFAVIDRQGCLQFTQKDLPKIVSESEAIAKSFGKCFAKAGPLIDLEALRSLVVS